MGYISTAETAADTALRHMNDALRELTKIVVEECEMDTDTLTDIHQQLLSLKNRLKKC